MATTKTALSNTLSIKVEDGSKTVTRTLSNVDPALPDDDARQLMSAFAGLQSRPLKSIIRTEISTLEEE